MTRFQLHVQTWKDCTRCELHECRSQVVLARGSVPCDVMFIGEAPGFSEDALGSPFVGRAGHLLDDIIRYAIPHRIVQDEQGIDKPVFEVRIGFTNLVCCIPKEPDGSKSTEPDDSHIRACQPRLAEYIDICKPKLIVRVGKLAGEFLDQSYKYALKVDKSIRMITITHPAGILRAVTANQTLMRQRCVVQVAKAVRELMHPSPVPDIPRPPSPPPSASAAFNGHEYDFLSDDGPLGADGIPF